MPAKKEKSFEDRLQQLETIVKELEDGGMTLSDSMKAYEQGEKLAEELKKDLTAAEERLTVLHGGEA